MSNFSIISPLESEYFTTVRLTTGGVCALADFDVESTEDFKVCVTECLLLLKRSGFSSARISYTLGQPLLCEIVGQERTGEMEEEDGISLALLDALLGNVEYVKDEQGKVIAVKFNA